MFRTDRQTDGSAKPEDQNLNSGTGILIYQILIYHYKIIINQIFMFSSDINSVLCAYQHPCVLFKRTIFSVFKESRMYMSANVKYFLHVKYPEGEMEVTMEGEKYQEGGMK